MTKQKTILYYAAIKDIIDIFNCISVISICGWGYTFDASPLSEAGYTLPAFEYALMLLLFIITLYHIATRNSRVLVI